MLAAVVGILLVGLLAGAGALHQPPAALGAAARHLHHQRHGEAALGIARAGQEAAEPAGLDHQVPPALGADLLADLVGHLDAGTLQIFFRLLQVLVKVSVKFPQHALPGRGALLHGVQLLLHMGGEFQIGDVGEFFLHQRRHHPAQVGDVEVLALLHDILPVQDSGHGGGVGGGPADALLLHSPDQRGVGVMGRGLGEVLVPGEILQRQDLPLPQGRQGRFLLFLLLVLALLVHSGVAGEFQAGGAGAETVSGGVDLHRDAVIHGVGHLAGHVAAPDQLVEPVLLSGQVFFELLRRPFHIAGADGLMGILGVGLGLVAVGLRGIVVLAVAAENKALCGGDGLLGDPQGVGTHVGDQAHGALPLDIHALVELLGDGHGPPGRHGELPGRLLLHGGGGERGRGAALFVGALDALDSEGGVFRLPNHRIHLFCGFQLRLFAILTVIAGGKGDLLQVVAQEVCVQGPVLLRLEGLDLPVPVIHHPGSHGLYPPGGEPAADLLPQQGAELVTHDPVQDTAGLLGIHQVLIDVPGLLDTLLNHLLGDLVKGHPPGLLVRQVQKLLQMPGNGLALPVRVGGKVDHVGVFCGFLQGGDNVLLALDGLIDRLEIVLQVHAQHALGQVPQMAHAGGDLEILAQIFPDGFGLRRRLHDDQAVLCHSYLRIRTGPSRPLFPLKGPYGTASPGRGISRRRTDSLRQCHGAGVPLAAVLFNQMLDLQHCQGGKDPAGGEVGQLDQIVHQHGLLLRKGLQQSDLIVSQAQIIVGEAHRGRHRSGLRLLPGLIAQYGGLILRFLRPQLVREPGLVFLQEVPGLGHQAAAVPDQPVAAHAGRRVDGTGDGEHLPALLQGGTGSDQCAAALRGLHHQRGQAQPGENAVADRKVPSGGLRARRVLA